MPWAYFHLLNILQVSVLALLGFGMAEGDTEWFITLPTYAVITLILLGLKDIGVAMADPFGDDVIDFKVEQFLSASYANAVAHLSDERPPLGSRMPKGLRVPMIPEAKIRALKHQTTFTGV